MHGCPGSTEDWDPIRSQLSQKYHVTAFDRPGHGFSSVAANSCNLDFNAGVTLEVIETLGLKDVLVVGHSYGAATALRIAIQNPSHIHA
ncbi:MAG: alpha/beta hydrolase, partial [Elusimicrobia bacterium]|nr:alpha/beta hydrolase [Elusimicrobiota bacterium]